MDYNTVRHPRSHIFMSTDNVYMDSKRKNFEFTDRKTNANWWPSMNNSSRAAFRPKIKLQNICVVQRCSVLRVCVCVCVDRWLLPFFGCYCSWYCCCCCLGITVKHTRFSAESPFIILMVSVSMDGTRWQCSTSSPRAISSLRPYLSIHSHSTIRNFIPSHCHDSTL